MIHKKCFIFALLLCIVLACLSCQKEQNNNAVVLLKSWMGKEIFFPNTLLFYNHESKVIPNKDNSKKFSILSYVDSIGCLSCRFNLESWAKLQEEIKIYDVPINIYIHSEEKEVLKQYLRRHRVDLNICFDDEDSLNRLNRFSTEMMFQTFLLDKDNKVIAIGNPVHNPKVKELYMNIIQGKTTTKEENAILTKVQVKENTLSLGRFNWQEEQKAQFTIYNVGKRPLVINDVSTSCGCTSVDYPKQPISAGDSVSLQVAYKADHPEHFDKTITVYCNTNPSLIQLKITGDAE